LHAIPKKNTPLPSASRPRFSKDGIQRLWSKIKYIESNSYLME